MNGRGAGKEGRERTLGRKMKDKCKQKRKRGDCEGRYGQVRK